MRAERQLLQHAAPVMDAALRIAAAHVAQRLHVEMLLLPHIDIGQYDVFPLDREVAMVEPVRPFGVAIAEAEHEEIVDRRERRFEPLRTFAENDGGWCRVPGAGFPV